MKKLILTLVLLIALPHMLHAEKKESKKARPQYLVFLGDRRPVLLQLDVMLNGKSMTQAWSELIAFLFKSLDTDKDGGLDAKELARIPAPETILSSIRGSRDAPPIALKDLDTDASGKISPNELAEFFAQRGASPFTIRFSSSPAASMSGRGYFSMMGQGGPRPDELNREIFALLDSDKDGQLSTKKLAAFEKKFLRRDANDDEIITTDEVLGKAEVSGGVGNLIILGGGATADSTSEKDLPLMQADSRSPSRDLARRLLSVYGAKDKQKLTREDLGLRSSVFKKLDVDGDGRLDSEELARFAQRAPDLRLVVRLGEKEKTGVEIVLPKDNDKNDALRKVEISKGKNSIELALGRTRLTFSASNSSGSGVGIKFGGLNSTDLYKMQFMRADRDNNGYLDKMEARRVGSFGMRFATLDKDGDGKVFLKEALAVLAEHEEIRQKVSSCTCMLSISEKGNGLFDMLDTNHDGRLTLREMRQTASMIKKLDDNNDKKLAKQEIPRQYQAAVSPGVSASNPYGNRVVAFVANGSGSLPVPGKKGPNWFQKMDRNGDYDLSPREFLGSVKLFKDIDKDGDGLISIAEAEAAEARLKKE